MCARFTTTSSMQKLQDYYNAGLIPRAASFAGSYNLAPTEIAPIVIENERQNRVIDLAKFGITVKYGAKNFPLLNLQLEKAANREDFKKRRCVIPANGFYEWEKISARDKQPYYFSPIDGMFAFGGVWKRDGNDRAFSILTISANDVVSKIHQRMPVILSHNTMGQWLANDANPESLLELMQPYPDGLMQSWKVSKLVNKATNKNAACINSL